MDKSLDEPKGAPRQCRPFPNDGPAGYGIGMVCTAQADARVSAQVVLIYARQFSALCEGIVMICPGFAQAQDVVVIVGDLLTIPALLFAH
jgi:hypothetical protein